MSKLLGRYHFEGPYKCRPINDYTGWSGAPHAARKFGNTIANRLLGSCYESDWRPVAYGKDDRSEWWQFEITILRRDPKIPSRTTPRHIFIATIRYILP